MQPYLFVFLYKDGLLARLAHDLRLRVERFGVELTAGRLEAWFDLHSLQVDGVMRRGRLVADELSERDCEQILQRTWDDVLQVGRFPQARFIAELQPGPPPSLLGQLHLSGREQTLSLSVTGPAEADDNSMLARGRLVPSRWGIAPFRALGGALRLKDTVDVEAGVPWQGLPPVPAQWARAQARWTAGAGRGP